MALALWLALVAFMIALSYASRATEGKPKADVLYRWSTAINGVVLDLVVLVLVLAIAGFRLELLALRRPRSWLVAVGLVVALYAGVYVVEGIYTAIAHPGNEQGLTPKHWEPAHATAYVVNAVVICTWVPFVEELTYRGLGYTLLERFGRWPAILAVGLLFGLAHGLLLALPVIAFFGCALAWLRARTDSVLPGMLLHALFNLTALVVAVAL